jgi:hypothetical protein
MSDPKQAKRRSWYSPMGLANLANNGFLAVARGTGTAIRGIQDGSVKGISSLAKPLKRAPAEGKKAPSGAAPAPVPSAAEAPAKPPTAEPIPAPIAQETTRVEPAPQVVIEAPAVKAVAEPVAPEAPVAAPVVAPVPEPVAAPVPSPVAAPVVARVAAPVAAPVAVPVAVPVAAPVPAPVPVAVPPPARVEGGGAPTGLAPFLRSIWASKPKAGPSAPSAVKLAEAVAPRPVQVIPKQPIDVEALVAAHHFDNRAEMLTSLVCVNEFLQGGARESAEAQRQILARAAPRPQPEGAGRTQVNTSQASSAKENAFAEAVFLAALQRRSTRLAELALDGLVRLNSTRLVAALKDLFSSDVRELRLVALRVANRLKEDEAAPLFSIAARDAAPEVRRRLVAYLSWRGTPFVVQELLGLSADANAQVKWAAIGVLARLDSKAALEMVGRIPPTDEDRSYRRRIEAALAKKKCPEHAASQPEAKPRGKGQ